MVSRYAEYLAAVAQRDQFVLMLAALAYLALAGLIWLGGKNDRINQHKAAILVVGFYLTMGGWLGFYWSLAH
jgi:ammonia channel protein AmtB